MTTFQHILAHVVILILSICFGIYTDKNGGRIVLGGAIFGLVVCVLFCFGMHTLEFIDKLFICIYGITACIDYANKVT